MPVAPNKFSHFATPAKHPANDVRTILDVTTCRGREPGWSRKSGPQPISRGRATLATSTAPGPVFDAL
jgi:hypothetical protein